MLTIRQALSDLQEKADRLQRRLKVATNQLIECEITYCPMFPETTLHLEVRRGNNQLLDTHVWDIRLQPHEDALNKMFHLIEVVLMAHIAAGGEEEIEIMISGINAHLVSLLTAAGIQSQFPVHDDYDWVAKAANARWN